MSERSYQTSDGITLYINCCEYCPFCEDKVIFRSIIDSQYDRVEKWCSKVDMKLLKINTIPIECPLPPRSRLG